LCHELLNAQPYAFLDDAPLEERRAHAVYTRRAGEPGNSDFAALDPAAICRVCEEAQPDPRDADELHDALLTHGFLTAEETRHVQPAFFSELRAAKRIVTVTAGDSAHVAIERAQEFAALVSDHYWLQAVGGSEGVEGGIGGALGIVLPASRRREWSRDEALVEIMRGRVALVGPTTAAELAKPLALDEGAVTTALESLEGHGVVLRGRFRPGATGTEWCERNLLARIHRYTLARLRAEIEPVSPADFMRFLFDWQHLTPAARLTGLDGVLEVIKCLDGFELPAGAWEASILPARVEKYTATWTDMLCLTGQVSWARLSRPQSIARVVRTTPIAMFLREHADAWARVRHEGERGPDGAQMLRADAARVLAVLSERGALFAHEIAVAAGVSIDVVRQCCAELVSAGLITSDGFAGLRGLLAEADAGPREMAGRWALVQRAPEDNAAGHNIDDRAVEVQARALLRRYGVVCRRIIAREANALPWRVLARAYRTLEARGEIRGGRFVNGLAGEQFALPEAVERLREIRRTPPDDKIVLICAADPLNLAGIVTAGERVPALAATRMAYRNGVPLAALEGDYMRPLTEIDAAIAAEVASALTGRRMPPVVSGFVGRAG
jgi:ATP-dependent Lhr-like helicase